MALPEGPTYGVMLDAKDYLGEDGPALLKAAFVPSAQSPLGLVRIAAHRAEIPRCGPMVASLAALGYRVGLNVMQAGSATSDELADLAGLVAAMDGVSVFYFADSLGNMLPDDIRRVVAALRSRWSGEIGFHGHDNMGYGVANVVAAVEAGATWIDGTITGMGRGAGNAQMEYLLIEAQRRGWAPVSPAQIFDLAMGPFARMQREYGWGKNIFYYMGAVRSVHPTFVQEMLSSDRFETGDVLNLVDHLADAYGGRFSAQGVDEAMVSRFGTADGETDLTGRWAGRPVLFVASGPEAERHWPALRAHALAHNAAIVALNHLDFVDPADIEAVVCVHPARLIRILADETWAAIPLISPLAAFPLPLREDAVKLRTVLDYGMAVAPALPTARPRGCTVPSPLGAVHGWCAIAAGGAKEIWLAGFDGYDGASEKYRTMEAVFMGLLEALPLRAGSLTATHHSLPVLPLYGPRA